MYNTGVIWAIKFQFAPILLLIPHVTIKIAFIKSSENHYAHF